MNKQVIVSAQYKLLDNFNYIVTIKAKNEHNELIYDGQQTCRFLGDTPYLPLASKEKLVKKNVRNILYHAKRISLGTKIVTSITRYGDIPPQLPVPEDVQLLKKKHSSSKLYATSTNPDVEMHAKEGYFTVKDPKIYGDLRDQRIWQVVLLNGNPTIVRAENPRLSSQEAKELLFKKILGENNG